MNSESQNNIWGPMFIAELFTVVKEWKQPKCMSVDKWIKKMWYMPAYVYIHTIFNNMDELRLHYAEWNKSEKDKYCNACPHLLGWMKYKMKSRLPWEISTRCLCASRVQLFATLWTVASQAPLSIDFSRQEYWSGLPFPSPGDLPDPEIEPVSPTLQTDS